LDSGWVVTTSTTCGTSGSASLRPLDAHDVITALRFV
jgi:hypothetical protein